MKDFAEASWKMDKWATEDFDVQNRYWELIDSTEYSTPKKIEVLAEMLEDEIIVDEERLNSYIDGEYTLEELAEYLIITNR